MIKKGVLSLDSGGVRKCSGVTRLSLESLVEIRKGGAGDGGGRLLLIRVS